LSGSSESQQLPKRGQLVVVTGLPGHQAGPSPTVRWAG